MAEYGTYCDLDALKDQMENSDELEATDDAILIGKLEEASREIDRSCGRHFYIVSATRFYSPTNTGEFICPNDILSLSAIYGDKDNDRTWLDEWTASDYELYPFNRYPKWKILRRPDGDYSFLIGASRLKLVGQFGYGDGSSDPTKAAGSTVTVATTTGTTVSAQDGTKFQIGNTVKAGSEQLYVTGISANNLTVVRGVNGTTAAIHAAVAAYIYQYPTAVKAITRELALKLYRAKDVPQGSAGSSEFGPARVYTDLDRDQVRRLGDYRRQRVA